MEDTNQTTHSLLGTFLHCFHAAFSLSLDATIRWNIKYKYNKTRGQREARQVIAIQLELG